MNPFVTGYRCMVGDHVFTREMAYTCPDHGAEGILDIEFDLARVAAAWDRKPLAKRPRGIWRFRELLPLDDFTHLPPVPVGDTPLWESPRLAAAAGLRGVYIKDDGRGPTGSLKDRASVVGVAHALARHAHAVACASTGNAASSLAGAAAGAGLPAYIFVPARAPEPKVTQLKAFGAEVFQVEGTYEEAYALCTAACARFGWYNRNCAVNPVLVEGKKTAGLEIAEALENDLPDWVAVSVGDGCTAAGVAKGLREYAVVTGLERVPRVLGVQAAGAAPVVRAFDTYDELVPVRAETVADSIAVGTPRNWRKVIRYLREGDGRMIAVDDAAIDAALLELARVGGCFSEPAAATAWAGVRRAREAGILGAGDRVVVLSTGNGLKDVAGAARAAGPPRRIPPDIDRVAEIVERTG